jgi:precorrin-2 dehydrogenase/sirohydrochlorin ferrochelatase
MIPLFHDFHGEAVLVVGGGSVGARKARRFAAEADVTVLSPAFGDREFGDADLVEAAPGPQDAADWVARVDPALVVAATDDESVNAAFADAAREAGALVNRADESRGSGREDDEDDEEAGRGADSVVVPATAGEDPVTVAVSTGGRSPALSKYLRQRFEAEFAGAGAMAELTDDLRADLKAAGVPAADRRDAVRAVVRSEPVWKALRTGDANPRERAEAAVRRAVGDVAWST